MVRGSDDEDHLEENNFRVVVAIHDLLMTVSSDGTPEGTVFEGAEPLCNQAYNAAYLGLRIPLGDDINDPIVRAGFDSPLAITAALYSIAPQYALVVEAPQEVWDAVRNQWLCGRGSVKLTVSEKRWWWPW